MKNKNINIVSKLYNRQLCGRVTGGRGPPEREVRLCEPRQPWYYFPLKSIIDTHQALLKGHVLLGFLKDGIHLISYLCQVEPSEVDILHSLYTYTLYIWRFDLGSPLHKVWTYPLFVGETITSDLQLVICEAAENDRLVVHGAEMRLEETSSSRQCYVSVFPSPDRMLRMQHDLQSDAYFVHFKYDMQPPYPPFSPLLSLKLRDSVVCNTGDSITVLTVQTHSAQCASDSHVALSVPPSPAPSSTASHSSEGESDISDVQPEMKKTKFSCSCPALRSSEHLSTCIVGRMGTVHVATECDLFSPVLQQRRKRFRSNRRLASQSPKIMGDKKSNQVDTVTTFSNRVFGLSPSPNTQGRTRYDAIQTLYPVLATSLIHGSLRPTYTWVSEHPLPHTTPLHDDFVTVQQASFDAELYINTAVGEHAALSARYLSLRDYDMRLLEVCQGSNTVLVLIMVLCIANHDTQPHKEVLVSSGFILSWNVSTGAATTLELLPIEEFANNSCSAKRWCPGAELALELRKKWFVPCDYNKSVRAFSNASVFSGQSLTKLPHPYLPVAIILENGSRRL
ncbi:hypothetical protein ACHWQZ_G003230 [Mnemiopsis leidyi]